MIYKGLNYGKWNGACWWKLILKYKWDETIIYVRPFKIWWHSEHLAKWFGKERVVTVDGVDVGFRQRILKLWILGTHIWSNY